jgi:hypothetical protein
VFVLADVVFQVRPERPRAREVVEADRLTRLVLTTEPVELPVEHRQDPVAVLRVVVREDVADDAVADRTRPP